MQDLFLYRIELVDYVVVIFTYILFSLGIYEQSAVN